MSQSEEHSPAQDRLLLFQGSGEIGDRMRSFDWSATPLGKPEAWPQSLCTTLGILLPSRVRIALFWGAELTTFYNDAASSIFGTRHPGALGRPLKQLAGDLQLQGLSQILHNVYSTGKSETVTGQSAAVITALGANGPACDISCDPVRDEAGQIAGVFCIFTGAGTPTLDATTASTASVTSPAITSAIAHFEPLLSHAPIGVYLVDADLRIRAVNELARPVFNEIPGGVIDRDFDDVIHRLWKQDYADEMVRILRHTLKTGESCVVPERRESRIDCQVTQSFAWQINRITFPGGQHGLICYFRDISEEATTRQKIDDYSGRLQLALEASGMGTFVWHILDDRSDLDTRVRLLFGLPDTATLSFGPNLQHVIHHADRQRYAQAVQRALDPQGTGILREDIRIRQADGTERWLTIRGQTQFDNFSRRAERLVGMAADITDRKRREANLAFLAEAQEDFARLSSSPEIVCTIGEKLGRLLNAETFYFLEIDESQNHARSVCAWDIEEVSRLPAEGHISDFVSEEITRAYRAGEAVVINDSETDPRTVAEKFRGVRTRSAITVPFHHQGEWKYVLGISDSRPRDWREDDIELIRELSNRLFPRLERARAEEALRIADRNLQQMRARLDSALKAGLAGTFFWDITQDRVITDDNLRQYFSLSDMVLAKGVPQADFLPSIHRDDLARVTELLQSAVRSGAGYSVEFRVHHLDGSRRWLSARGAVERNADGAAIGLSGFAVDITRLKEAEHALRDSEELFRALVTASSDVVYRMSPDWTRMHQIHGSDFVHDTQVPTSDWLETYINAEDRPHIQGLIQEAIRNKSVFELEHRVRRYDGSLGWMISRAIPVLTATGEIKEWLGTANDVTLRKQMEDELRQNQERVARQRRLYEAILSNTPDLAYIFDLKHRFIYANEGLLKMWGRTWEDAVGKTCLELGYERWHAEMHGREIDQVAATKLPLRGEVPFNGTFGRRIYDYILVPVFGPTGEVEAVAGTTRDVTDIKEADRRKDEFLATLAHELRNPLAPIRSAIHILTMSLRGDATVERICGMMERQVSHMVRLVDDLLEISRITRGTIELRKEQTTLHAVINAAVDTSNPAIAAGHHQLTINLPPDPITINGDSVRLAQIVANLLTNAARYTDAGGQIWLDAGIEGQEIVIRVRDNGIGIPPHLTSKVFDMFMQVDRTSRRSQGGLGIGLTLVKRLVEMHGGTITAHSPGLDAGSEFIVRLPHTLTERTNPDVPKRPPVASLQRPRVLIVDDNHDAGTSLGILIKMLGAEVQVAQDGATGLEMMKTNRPDLVFLDLGMPVMDGFEVVRRARQIPNFENVVCVALTGWGQADDRERTRAAGFNLHLVKPAGVAEIQAVLDSLSASGPPGGPVASSN